MRKKIMEGTEFSMEIDVMEIVSVDTVNIADEFLRQAGKYAWYATMLAHAKARKDAVKLELDIQEANLDAIVRQEATKAGMKITESVVHHTVVSLAEYKTAYENWIKAKEDESILDAVVKALEQRKDMLIQYGSLVKQELISDVGILEKKMVKTIKGDR